MSEATTVYDYLEKALNAFDVGNCDKVEISIEEFPGVDFPYRMEFPRLVVKLMKVSKGMDVSCGLFFQYFEKVDPHVDQAELVLERYKDYIRIVGAKELRFRFTIEGNKMLSFRVMASFQEEWNLKNLSKTMFLLVNQMLTMFILLD